MTELSLGAEFPTADRDEWLSAVEKVLRGKPFDRVLVGATRDGLDIQPLYTEFDGTSARSVPVDPERIERGWDVRQVHDGGDPDVATAVIAELERGVTSIELTAPAGGWSLDAIRAATDGVLLDLAPIVLAPHADVESARALHALVVERGHAATTGSWLGLDPIGGVARGEEGSVEECVAAAAELAPTLPRGRTITVDSTRYADAGATEAEELGWAIATAVAYLRAFERIGTDPGAAATTIGFRMSAGADQFMTIASLRAARRLWGRVLDACGVPAESWAHSIQAVTSRAMYSRRDPWVNMLRATTASLAAGVGGADAITVLPFDDALGVPDAFSRRIARNTQLLLIEESHLATVVDPAAGSWFVESLTDRLAAAAWGVFQGIEAKGGIEAALADGSIADDLEAAWNRRLAEIGTRRAPITGVSEFPDIDETPVVRSARPAASGFPVRRMAAPFEALRDAADRALAATGSRPSVHLAALGPLATHTARSTWITNFLAVGGVAAVGGDTDGSASPIEAEARFSETGASVAVICSSDGVYAERAAATATALKEAGAKVVLAGAPGDLRDELLAAGVDEFWHVGVDVLDALTRLHADLGI
ncbi:MAG: methylmalonyl-CoA mutase family protein [Acidimicrobiales bacterium]